jgi:hypothetical protein
MNTCDRKEQLTSKEQKGRLSVAIFDGSSQSRDGVTPTKWKLEVKVQPSVTGQSERLK